MDTFDILFYLLISFRKGFRSFYRFPIRKRLFQHLHVFIHDTPTLPIRSLQLLSLQLRFGIMKGIFEETP